MVKAIKINSESRLEELSSISKDSTEFEAQLFNLNSYQQFLENNKEDVKFLLSLKIKYKNELSKNPNKKVAKYLNGNIEKINVLLEKIEILYNKINQITLLKYEEIAAYINATIEYHSKYNTIQRKLKDNDLQNDEVYKNYLHTSNKISKIKNLTKEDFEYVLKTFLNSSESKVFTKFYLKNYLKFNGLKKNINKHIDYVLKNIDFNSIQEVDKFEELSGDANLHQEDIDFINELNAEISSFKEVFSFAKNSAINGLQNSSESKEFFFNIDYDDKIKHITRQEKNKYYFNLIEENNKIINFLINKRNYNVQFENIDEEQKEIDSLIACNENIIFNILSKKVLTPKQLQKNINKLNEIKSYNLKNYKYNILKNNDELKHFQNNIFMFNLVNSRIQQILKNDSLNTVNLEQLFILNLMNEQLLKNNKTLILNSNNILTKNTIEKMNNNLIKSRVNCLKYTRKIKDVNVISSRQEIDSVLCNFSNYNLTLKEKLNNNNELYNNLFNVNNISVNNEHYECINNYDEKLTKIQLKDNSESFNSNNFTNEAIIKTLKEKKLYIEEKENILKSINIRGWKFFKNLPCKIHAWVKFKIAEARFNIFKNNKFVKKNINSELPQLEIPHFESQELSQENTMHRLEQINNALIFKSSARNGLTV